MTDIPEREKLRGIVERAVSKASVAAYRVAFNNSTLADKTLESLDIVDEAISSLSAILAALETGERVLTTEESALIVDGVRYRALRNAGALTENEDGDGVCFFTTLQVEEVPAAVTAATDNNMPTDAALIDEYADVFARAQQAELQRELNPPAPEGAPQ